MKKLLSVVLATLMLISVFPFALPQNVTAATTERIAYLDGRAGDDSTAEIGNSNKEFKTFKEAYNALCPEGGTILFTAPYDAEQSSVTGLTIHHGEIIITANGNYDNYWFMADYNETTARYTQWTIKFAGPVIIEKIALVESGKTAAATSAGIAEASEYIFANFNPITIGLGVKCYSSKPSENSDTKIPPALTAITEITTPTTTGISVNGGTLNVKMNESVIGSTSSTTYNNRLNQMKRDTCVTVNSGVWRAVVGGSRHDIADYKTVYNGNYRVYFNGGNASYIIGANWGTDVAYCGGQAYIYMAGGTAGTIITGHQAARNMPLRNSIMVWTAGTVTKEIIVRNTADTTILYGGDVGLYSSYTGAANTTIKVGSSGDKRIFECDAVSTPVRVRDGKAAFIVPLCNVSGQTVYVNQSTGSSYGTGSEDKPVNSLLTAIAMFNLVGGKIVLQGDYAFSTYDTTSLFAFREPDHQPIVIDGGSSTAKITNTLSKLETVTLKNDEHTVSSGFDNYILSGDTTFQNIDFAFANEMNFSANFNHITMGDDIVVSTEKQIRVMGANYYPASREGNGNTYNISYRPQYADSVVDDTHITIKSGKFGVIAFSRIMHSDKEIPYSGSALIEISGGHILNIYGASTNSAVTSSNSATINVSGDTVVDELYMGGYKQNEGTVETVTINISDNVVVGKFIEYDNCTGTAVYNINNNDFATYVAAYNAVGSFATVTTEMTAPVINGLTVGAKDLGDGKYAVRAQFKTACGYFVGEAADLYDIVELGVLVATEANADAIKYVQGDYYYGATEFVENPANFEGKIGKSVAYVKENDEADSYDAYKWAGEDADDTAVYFTAPIYDIGADNLETAFVFVPYMVMVDAAGNQQVFYGDATDAVSYNSIIANAAN